MDEAGEAGHDLGVAENELVGRGAVHDRVHAVGGAATQVERDVVAMLRCEGAATAAMEGFCGESLRAGGGDLEVHNGVAEARLRSELLPGCLETGGHLLDEFSRACTAAC